MPMRIHARNKNIHVIALVLLGILIYSNAVSVPFILDDVPDIVRNPIIKDFKYLFEPSSLHIDRTLSPNIPDYQGFSRTRFIGYLTFAINYSIHGLDVKGYHIVNIAIHVVNSLLVYLLIGLTLNGSSSSEGRSSRLGRQDDPRLVALFSSLIFLSHPVNTQAVTYIVQRFTALATLFYLASIILYVRFRVSESRRQQIIYYVACLASIVLGMLTKEIAFTIPFMIGAYEFIFFKGDIKPRLLCLAPILMTIFVIPMALLSLHPLGGDVLTLVGNVSKETPDIGRVEYLMTQGRVIATYTRLLLMPVNLNLDYDYPIYRDIRDVEVILSIAFLFLMISAAVWLICRGRARNDRYCITMAFGMTWYILALSVESSLIPIRDVIFEHRVYLPSVGFILALVTAAMRLRDIDKHQVFRASKAVPIILVAIVFLLSIATYRRNHVWTDDIRLWLDVVSKSPLKARAYNQLGISYDKRGYHEFAISSYNTAIRLKPDYFDAHNNLGLAYLKVGRIEEGTRELRAAFAKGHFDLGVRLTKQGYTEKAVEEFKKAIEAMPYFAAPHTRLGLIYGGLGRFDKAAEEFMIVVALKPDDPEAHNNLGMAYAEEHRYVDAMREFTTAMTLDRNNAEAHYNMGIVLKKQDRFEDAKREFESSIRLSNGHVRAEKQLEIMRLRLESQ